MASPMNTQNSPMAGVKEGMDVYSGDNKIGTVKDIYFGDEGDSTDQSPAARATATAAGNDPTRVDTLATEFANAFDGYDMNETVRNRLMSHGFIRIDTGLLGSDKFAMTEYIASASGDRVELSTSEDALISK